MANQILLKRASGSDPTASDLALGEIAIRTDNGKLFTKKDNGTVAEISGAGGGNNFFINTLSSSSGSGGGSASFNGTATRFELSNPPNLAAQLLVSIDGVIQKPNTGTSPSEGFAVDGNDIIFSSAPSSGADFFIVTYASLAIAEPSDNTVTSAKIVDGAIVNADINASAAIAGTKISPDFGNQIVRSGEDFFIDVRGKSFRTNDWDIFNTTSGNGLSISGGNSTSVKIAISKEGNVDVVGNLDVGAGIDVTGAITGTGDLTIDTNTLHVDSSNNRVGIGTTSPAEKLDVIGNIKFGSNSNGLIAEDGVQLVFKANIAGREAHIMTHDGSEDINLNPSGFIQFECAGSERMRIDSSGRVLIGQTSSNNSTSMLQLKRANNNTIRLANSDATTTNFVALDLCPANSLIGARIVATADGTFSSSSAEDAHLKFFTTADGTSSERMRIDSSGRVMINTSTFSLSKSPMLEVKSDSNTAADFAALFSANNQTAAIGISYNQIDSFDATNTASLHLLTNGTERMRINSSGNVVVGSTTANGSDACTLNSDGEFRGAGFYFSNNIGSPMSSDGIRRATTGTMVFDTASAERMRLDASGRLLIGSSTATASTNTKLKVHCPISTSSSTAIEISQNTNGANKAAAGLGLAIANGGESTNAADLNFQTASGGSLGTRMTLTSSGNLGINQINPSKARLHVVGDDTDGDIVAKFKSGGGGADSKTYIALISGYPDNTNDVEGHARIGVQRAGAGNGTRLLFETQPSSNTTYINALKIDEHGRTGVHYTSTTLTARFGVETTANTMVPVQINDSSNTSTLTHRILFSTGGTEVGRIRCTNSGTQYNTSGSDRSMKKNFELWDEDVLSLFKNINPQKFNFIQEEDGATKSKGFIAQELANSFPEAYSKGEEEDDKYWFNPSGMVVYLMKALQEAVARIEVLEAK